MDPRGIEDFLKGLSVVAVELHETREELKRLREALEKVISFGPAAPAGPPDATHATPGRTIANAAADVLEAIAKLQQKRRKGA